MSRQISFHSTLLFLFLLQPHEVLTSFSSENHLCHYHDAIALLQFKGLFNTNASTMPFIECDFHCLYSYPKMISWNASKDCCSWDGITCDQLTGHLVGLDLTCSHLQGAIPPNSSLFHLSHLQRLNLACNDLTGSQISHEFGTLRSLTHLNLSYSNFQGEIAAEISHLSSLISLDFSGNSGCSMGPCSHVRHEPCTFHKMLQNLTHLRELSLFSVNIASDITMNLSSSLTYLDIGDTGVYGNLPINIFLLPKIQVLLLSGNIYLSGSLPKFNCSILSSLKRMEIIDTNFSGVLPDSIGCLKSLNSLVLGYCLFSGAIPESIGNLTQLVELDLGGNYFNSHVPTSISNLQSVKIFSLGGNHLEGLLADSFANFTKLTDLDLRQNSLVGQFPISLLNLTYLSALDLSYNLLKGQLGDFKSRSLWWIVLSSNQLSGSIPCSIFTLANLFKLDLSSNRFRGIELNVFQNNPPTSRAPMNTTSNSNFSSTYIDFLGLSSCEIKEFPDFLRNFVVLYYLDLSNNEIHGQIPSWFMSKTWNHLGYLNVSHNFLTGTIDQLPCYNLQYLDMSSNLLQGQLPSSICNTSFLEILDLSDNNLISTIPQCLGNSSNQLSLLDFGSNGFFGTIPATFSNDNQLRILILNDNQLVGPLPRSLANCTALKLFDLGNNKIDDKFPMWLETITELQVLILKSNQFHGSIDNCKTTSPFPQLRIIDVSCNELTGVLPTELLKNFKAMSSPMDHQMELQYMTAAGDGHYYYIHSVSLVMKGVEYNFERVLTTRAALDFSSNRFEGEIPKLIGDLHSLQILNLSHNNLSGHIPRSFGNLNMLESLDLSWNQLEGTIPVELQNLTFLGFLNLSENHLVGPIPQGRHFDTFENKSYLGNLALCGFPLTKDCGDSDAPPTSPSMGFEEEHDSGFFDGFTWEAVLLGYCFGLLLGFAMGCLMFITGKPRCFIQIVEEIYKLRKRPRKWIHMRH